MLVKFFKNGQGGGAAPIEYLLAAEVAAYDGNRNIRRDAAGQAVMVKRKPLPEIIHGDAKRLEALIDNTPFQWSYRAGVLAFTAEDAPSHDQQLAAIQDFDELAFAGLAPDQRDILWVRHTHEGRVELHFLTPRMELSTGRSLNIAPPGYRDDFDALRDHLNKTYDWNDPEDPARALEAKGTIESPKRDATREDIHDWVFDQIGAGIIRDRKTMLSALQTAGYAIPRAGENYITVLDPVLGERWRLKGEIFHEGWSSAKSIERAAARSDRKPNRAGERLNRCSDRELLDRLQKVIAKRADYNRARFVRPQAVGPGDERGNARRDKEGRSAAYLDQPDWAFGGSGSVRGLDDRNASVPERPGAEGHGISAGADDGGTWVSDLREGRSDDLHLGHEETRTDDLPRRGAEYSMPSNEASHMKEEDYDSETPDPHPFRDRVDWALGEIKRHIREIEHSVRSIGEALRARDHGTLEHARRFAEELAQFARELAARLAPKMSKDAPRQRPSRSTSTSYGNGL